MIQCNTLNVKLSNSQLSKLKFVIINGTKVTLTLSSDLIGNSNDGTNFRHKLLLTDIEVSKICKGFGNEFFLPITFSKTQLSKMIQSGGIVGDLIAAIPQVMFLAGTEALKKVYH